MDLNPEAVFQRLENRASLTPHQDEAPPSGFRAAAVIAPLVERQGELHLIFNKRAAHLDNHAGQVSFPGGRRDPDDAHLLHTAQRELAEELSITAPQHQVLCRLPSRKVVSHYFVTPFAARIESGAQAIPERGEVAYAFEVPLAFLADPKRAERRNADVFGVPTTFYAWTHGGETIWGATGRMVADLLLRLGAEHLEA